MRKSRRFCFQEEITALKNIAICAYGKVGKELSEFICKQEHKIEFACTSSDDDLEEQINQVYSDNNVECFRRINLNSEKFQNILLEKNIDLVFLLWWPQIIKKKIIESVSQGFINLHPSLLPYNRGKHPYYWSIVDGTPAGVSIHFISPGIDDGDIIYQEKIETDITTTGEDLYGKSLGCIMDLFRDHFRELISGHFPANPQIKDNGTFHLSRELDVHSEINLEGNYKAIDLINILRARSFSNGKSSFFYYNEKKYFIRVNIIGEDEIENS